MSTPVRVQLSRKKGWKMPPNTVKVDRTTKWGNPFPVKKGQDAKTVVRVFNKILRQSQSKTFEATVDKSGEQNPIGGLQLLMWRNTMLANLHELRGKNLACWCKPGQPCHADVLLKLANRK